MLVFNTGLSSKCLQALKSTLLIVETSGGCPNRAGATQYLISHNNVITFVMVDYNLILSNFICFVFRGGGVIFFPGAIFPGKIEINSPKIVLKLP